MEINLTLTDIISVISIILATWSFVISYLVYKNDKPKIQLKYSINEIITPWIWKIYDVLTITISNVGKRSTMVSKQIYFEQSKRLWFIVPYMKENYVDFSDKVNQELRPFTSTQTHMNLKILQEQINSWEINLKKIKRLSISDQLWNNYYIKLKDKDKKRILDIFKN